MVENCTGGGTDSFEGLIKPTNQQTPGVLNKHEHPHERNQRLVAPQHKHEDQSKQQLRQPPIGEQPDDTEAALGENASKGMVAMD